MKSFGRALAAAAFAMLSSVAAQAAPVVLTFEGVGDNNPVGDFYNGGAGGNYGIYFGSSALGLVSQADGGSGDFSGNPSGDTVLYFTSGSNATMNVAAGFNTGFSFDYADQDGFTGSVDVYSGLNGTGTLLTSLTLPSTPSPYTVFSPVGVTFSGTAESVLFGGSANFIAFDDITLGSSTPGMTAAAPEPATWMMMILGFGLVGGVMRRAYRKSEENFTAKVRSLATA